MECLKWGDPSRDLLWQIESTNWKSAEILGIMTVTLVAKHELTTDNNYNGTCMEKYCDHTESLLKDLVPIECELKHRQKPVIQHHHEKKNKNHRRAERKLLHFDEAPQYMKHNPYILTGYRGILNTDLCIESMFWWTNETVNIWSHVFGCVLFVALTVRDFFFLDVYSHISDKFVLGAVLVCFKLCMILSALYHTFSCRSETDCDIFLCYDLFGIALSLLAIYASGIYFAFWCEPDFQQFYMVTIIVIFIFAMILQLPQLNVNSNVKMLVFVAWALYGVVPTLHWSVLMGGFENPLVCLLVPRVLWMYIISGSAFLIYLTKIPERFCAGKFDFLGHSHQWWHLLVLGALFYWHESGLVYLNYRLNHACASNMKIY